MASNLYSGVYEVQIKVHVWPRRLYLRGKGTGWHNSCLHRQNSGMICYAWFQPWIMSQGCVCVYVCVHVSFWCRMGPPGRTGSVLTSPVGPGQPSVDITGVLPHTVESVLLFPVLPPTQLQVLYMQWQGGVSGPSWAFPRLLCEQVSRHLMHGGYVAGEQQS